MKTPLKPPDEVFTDNVRISSNPNDINIDILTDKLLKNKIFHKDFD
jgi:hypothetical protein